MLPQSLCIRRDIHVKELPKAYHNYKGKCLAEDTAGLSFKKPHCHEREVVAAASDPLLRKLSMCARAIRLAKKYSGDPGWTLWNQSKVTEEILCKAHKLEYLRDSRGAPLWRKCPCGENRCSPMAVVKVDAAQFFKQASVPRAEARAKEMFQRLATQKKCLGVAVKQSSRAAGQLWIRGKHIGEGSKKFTFDELSQAMAFCGKDNLFLLGSGVIERVQGWPMGGAMSPAATCIDLEHDLYAFFLSIVHHHW